MSEKFVRPLPDNPVAADYSDREREESAQHPDGPLAECDSGEHQQESYVEERFRQRRYALYREVIGKCNCDEKTNPDNASGALIASALDSPLLSHSGDDAGSDDFAEGPYQRYKQDY